MKTQAPSAGWEVGVDGQSLFEFMKDWGYYTLPPADHGGSGPTGLLVAIRQKPTGKHFDPEALRLRLRDRKGLATWTTLSWLSLVADSSHVCPGRVVLRDRSDRRVEFFTFGGLLETVRGSDEMVCSLRSPAPVLELDPQQEIMGEDLAAETEALMSKAEARWGQDEEGFNRRLAEVDPFQFYAATLHSILHYYESSENLAEAHHDCQEALLQEKRRLVARGLWPTDLALLEDLLAPDERPGR